MTGAHPLTPAQVALLEGHLAPRDRALLLLLFRACARISEALALRVGDVWGNGMIYPAVHFRRGTRKGQRQGHTVPLHQTAQDALRAWIAIHPSPTPSAPLFPALDRASVGLSPMSRVSAHRILKAALAAAGIAGRYSLHSLRKAGASHLVAETGQVRWAQAILGHAQIATTERYLAKNSQEADLALISLP